MHITYPKLPQIKLNAYRDQLGKRRHPSDYPFPIKPEPTPIEKASPAEVSRRAKERAKELERRIKLLREQLADAEAELEYWKKVP